MSLHKSLSFLLTLLMPLAAAAQSSGRGDFDVLIKNGTVYDGSGRAPRRVDVGIKEDRIVAVGNLRSARARNVIDARGLRSEEHTSELQSQSNLVCRLLLEKKKK